VGSPNRWEGRRGRQDKLGTGGRGPKKEISRLICQGGGLPDIIDRKEQMGGVMTSIQHGVKEGTLFINVKN